MTFQYPIRTAHKDVNLLEKLSRIIASYRYTTDITITDITTQQKYFSTYAQVHKNSGPFSGFQVFFSFCGEVHHNMQNYYGVGEGSTVETALSKAITDAKLPYEIDHTQSVNGMLCEVTRLTYKNHTMELTQAR